jgi:hypothetical protein
VTTTDKKVEGTEQTGNEQDTAAQGKKDEAAFEAGFNKVAKRDDAPAAETTTTAKSGDQTDTTTTSTAAAPEKKDGAATAETTGSAATTAEPAKDPWDGVPEIVRTQLEALASLPQQIRNLAGHLGGMKGQLTEAITAAKAAAETKGEATPSDKQITAALADPKAMERLMEEFPDFAGPVAAELRALHDKLDKRGTDSKVDVTTLKGEVKAEVRRELAEETVEEAHPGWLKTVQTSEFATWLNTQPADVKALAGSERARDAIKLLDTYTEHGKAQKTTSPNKDAQRARLHSATTPRGTSSTAAPSAISDEEAFNRGFKKVRAKAG